jgi:MYXO-CTERM domain-containing protein
MIAGKGIAALPGRYPCRLKTQELDPMHFLDNHDDSRLLAMESSPEGTVKCPANQARKRRDVMIRATIGALLALAAVFSLATSVTAAPFFFSTGSPDFKMATATRPDNGGSQFEIETGDDFVLTNRTLINSATFQGLLVNSGLSDIGQVRVEIYRVFPALSDVGRTSGPPTFSTPNVPTRVNSPSDVELVDRDTATGTLSFTPTVLATSVTALNSVQPGGIHPQPGQTTGGNGQVTGEQVSFDVSFSPPFDLLPGQYFFVPQVQITNGGEFLWLSAPRPIVAPGTPFPPGFTDLQSWTRDGTIEPDWLRVGTDIVGGTSPPTFNATFSLSGQTVPEPASLTLAGLGALGLLGYGWRRRKQGAA